MSSTTLQDSTSDLCTKLLDDARELRSACARSAHHLSKSKNARFLNAPPQLRLMVTSLRALEAPLTLLRNEIECGVPMEDLGELSTRTEESLWILQTNLFNHRQSLPEDLLVEIADDLYTIHQTSITLTAECTTLDDELCRESRARCDGKKASDLESCTRVRLHEQLADHLATDGSQCPICLEQMVHDTPTDPTITKCGHVFCEACIDIVVHEQEKCPMCRRDLPARFLFK